MYRLDDERVDRAQVQPTEPRLPGAESHRNRPVIEVPAGADAAAIQQAIDNAARRRGQRPVVHLPGGQYPIDRTLIIPANADLQLVGDGYSTNLRWTGTGAGPVLRLLGPTRATLREFEIDCGPSDWKPKPDAAVGVVVENCDQLEARIYLQQAQAQNHVGDGFHFDRLRHADVRLDDAHASDCGVGIRVVGGRAALFSGITTSNEITYAIEQGGRLLVRDTWYEGASPRFLHLQGAGEVTLSGAKIAPGRPGPNAPQTDPNYAGVQIDDYSGNVTFLTTEFGTRMNVHGPGGKTNVLVLGCNSQAPEAWVNNSPQARFVVLNSSHFTPLGTAPLPDQGDASGEFIRTMLHPLRTIKPKELAVVAEGNTDLRVYRVWIRFGSGGFVMKAE